jgi:hypothetical protein
MSKALSDKLISEGDRQKRLLLFLIELKLIRARRSSEMDKLIPLLEKHRERVASRSIITRRDIVSIKMAVDEFIDQFRGVLSGVEFEDLKAELVAKGLAKQGQFVSRSEKLLATVIGRGSIHTVNEFKAVDEYAKSLLPGKNADQLRVLDVLLGEYMFRRKGKV